MNGTDPNVKIYLKGAFKRDTYESSFERTRRVCIFFRLSRKLAVLELLITYLCILTRIDSALQLRKIFNGFGTGGQSVYMNLISLCVMKAYLIKTIKINISHLVIHVIFN